MVSTFTASDQLVVNSILASTISVIKLNFYTKDSGLFYCPCFNLKRFCMKGTCGNLYLSQHGHVQNLLVSNSWFILN